MALRLLKHVLKQVIYEFFPQIRTLLIQNFHLILLSFELRIGAKILLGTWPPVLPMFQMGLERDQFAEDMKLSDGSMMKIEKIYPLDATFDTQGNELLLIQTPLSQ